MVWLSLVAFFVASALGALVLRWSRRYGVAYGVDNPQRIHAGEVPRLGGVAIFCGIGIGWSASVVSVEWFGDPSSLHLQWEILLWLLVLMPTVFGGIADDLTQKVSVRYRLALTMLSGLLAVGWLGFSVPRLGFGFIDDWLVNFPWLGMAVALLAIGGLPHAFNIIDGCNGLAGVVALVICLALAHVALQLNDRALAALLVSTAAATGGFLVWNYPRGILFAGDGGAYLWGGFIALASIALVQRHAEVSPWFPMLLLIYPVVETVFSIYRKWARGSSPGMADGLHLHQLIYRRIVRRVFDDDPLRELLMRNNRTSPYLWGFTMLSVIPAVLFWGSSWVLMGFCLFFVLCYVGVYLAIVHFKVPGWLQG